jgi:hypothetical protein
MAAPLGNRNAARAKVWSAAIERALEKRAAERMPAINELAEKLIEMGLMGDLPALREIGDRLEGKPQQSTDITATVDATVTGGLAPIYGLQPPAAD